MNQIYNFLQWKFKEKREREMEQNIYITEESVKNVFKYDKTHKYMDSRSSVKQNKRNTRKSQGTSWSNR